MVVWILGAVVVVGLAGLTLYRMFRSWVAWGERSGRWWWRFRTR
jgi:hypothetical protein